MIVIFKFWIQILLSEINNDSEMFLDKVLAVVHCLHEIDCMK